MKAAFRDYLHKEYEKFKSGNPGRDIAEWKPNLNVGVMKPFLPGFVEVGIAALKSTEMKQATMNSFRDDGLFGEMRSEARYLKAKNVGVILAIADGLEDEQIEEEEKDC